MRAVLTIGALMLVAACSRADAVRDGVATDEGIAAIALPEEQYRYLLKGGIFATTSGPMFLAKLGLDEGCDVLDDAVDKVVDRNLPQWRSHLIAAYRDNVPTEQLAEAAQMSIGRARSELQPYMPAIGNAMRNASEPLLKSSAAEVLQVMGDAALKIDPASIDMQARQQELAEMKRSREICGVQL